MAEPKKKNIFDQVIDAVTNRDEKAAAEAAKLEAAAKAEAQARANMTAQQKTAADAKAAAEAAAKAAADAAAKVAADAKAKADAEIAAKAAEAKRQADLERYALERAEQERRAAEAAAKLRAELPHYKVVANDTLSAIAQKFYGHAAEPYWRLIYEANKEAIGSNPGLIRQGTELVIPVLPENLKK